MNSVTLAYDYVSRGRSKDLKEKTTIYSLIKRGVILARSLIACVPKRISIQDVIIRFIDSLTLERAREPKKVFCLGKPFERRLYHDKVTSIFSYIVLSIGTLNCAISFKGKMPVFPKVKAYLTHTLYMGQLINTIVINVFLLLLSGLTAKISHLKTPIL